MRVLLVILCIVPFSFTFGQTTNSDSKDLILHKISVPNDLLFPLSRYSLLHRYPAKEKESVLLVNQLSVQSNVSPTAFFCRIEDAIAKSSRINIKFRLGSVQYVDAMEGKGYFEALSCSQATNFQLRRQSKN
ncbi:MAG: hypothetical protein KDC53_00860 [Saprospiraceae bacterium]|nr:hypothetical protein [Saprospiraceae bacterium]